MTEKSNEENRRFDMMNIGAEIKKKLLGNEFQETDLQDNEQKNHQKHEDDITKEGHEKVVKEYIQTGVLGFDELFEHGIPKGSNVLISGGVGSGKTIFSLQTLAYHAAHGKKCFYMSFEESEEKLIEHMQDFNWNPEQLIKSGNLQIKRYLSSDIHYFGQEQSIEAMFAKDEDSQLIELEPISLQLGFKFDFIVLDSLTAIASAYKGGDSYRFYVERLFGFLRSLGSTNFLLTETTQIPEIFSPTGVEEFLADGVIVLYNIRRENIRENAIEVLKMRGAKHQKRLVAMQITDKGIVVYPDQEVFGGIYKEQKR